MIYYLQLAVEGAHIEINVKKRQVSIVNPSTKKPEDFAFQLSIIQVGRVCSSHYCSRVDCFHYCRNLFTNLGG